MMTWLEPLTSSPFGQGFLSDALNMDHLCFALMIGLMIFNILQRRRLLAAALAGNAIGIGIGAFLGTIPAAQFLVGLSLVLLVALVTAPQKFQRYLTFSLSIVGLLHGLLHANRYGKFLDLATTLSFIAGVLSGVVVLALAFGLLMRKLKQNPEGLATEVEHILVATASGSALAYIVMSF